MADSARILSNPEGVHPPVGGKYHHMARTKGSELLVLAGQVSLDINGNLVGEGDIAAQARQVFKNMGNVLKGASASFQNVVEFTTYVVGREQVPEYMNARTKIFDELFPEGDYPPNTLLIISGLAREEFLLEISAVAALP